MNTLTSVAPVITADRDALRRDFPLKPFAIRHKLAGHPLLMLPRIAQLASELPRDLIEYNSGKVAISQDPDAIPSVDLDPVEVVKSIETAGAWMVLKRVENSPEYRALLEDTLLSVARARGFNSLADAGFEQVEGFLFVSSPNSTTPFHLDSEDNFFVHIHGEKFFTIFDNADRTIVSDDEIERSMTKHRNLKYDESFAPRGQEFHLFAGDGCYVPYQWPHWVRTAGSFSISMAITWKTREVRRLNDLHFFNSMLRGIGLPQQPPGKTAGARCAQAGVLSHRHDRHQAAARLHGDAPRAAADRAGKTRELLSEGRVVAATVARVKRSATRDFTRSRPRIALRSIRATSITHCNGECGAGSMMVECISSRKPGPLPRNSCQAGSFMALPRASARAFRLG